MGYRRNPEYRERHATSEATDRYTEGYAERRRAAFYSMWELMYGRYLKEYKARKGSA